MLTAGDALAHADISRGAGAQIGGLTRPAVSEIMESVRRSYMDQRRKRIEENYLEPRGWKTEAFYRDIMQRLPADLALLLDNQIATFNYGLDVMVAGTDPTEGHIYGLRHPGQVDCYDALGYYAIGIGAEHALASLIRNGCTPQMQLPLAAYYIYEAKRAAESAPGVGGATDMVIVEATGHRVLTTGKVHGLERIWKERAAAATTEDLAQSVAKIISMEESTDDGTNGGEEAGARGNAGGE